MGRLWAAKHPGYVKESLKPGQALRVWRHIYWHGNIPLDETTAVLLGIETE